MHAIARSLPALAASTFLLLAAGPAGAVPCGATVGDDNASGDTYFAARWACRQDYVNFFWTAYHFDQQDWDEGFGFENVCDVNLPLARTFNALYALHYAVANPATQPGDFSGNILRWGGNYARTHIDELDGRCQGDNALAFTMWGPIIDNYTELYAPFFYGTSVVERASTILHESRHADGWLHDAPDSSCLRHASCDSSWNYDGANRWQVTWLWWYRNEATDTTPAMKARAKDRGNDVILNGFAANPGFLIP